MEGGPGKGVSAYLRLSPPIPPLRVPLGQRLSIVTHPCPLRGDQRGGAEWEC